MDEKVKNRAHISYGSMAIAAALMVMAVVLKVLGFSLLTLIGLIGIGMVVVFLAVYAYKVESAPPEIGGKIDISSLKGTDEELKSAAVALNKILEDLDKDDDSVSVRDNAVFMSYRDLIGKFVTIVNTPRFQENAYTDDKKLIKSLADKILPNIRSQITEQIYYMEHYSASNKTEASKQLEDISKQIEILSQGADLIQKHVMDSSNMDVQSAYEYLKQKLNYSNVSLDVVG